MNDYLRVGVYVGTYGKYNDGYIDGKWMFPADYDTLDDFIDACYELHSDEERDQIELMFQDCENLPRHLYDEFNFSEEAFDYAKYIDENPRMSGAATVYVDNYWQWKESDFKDRYYGEFDSLGDFAYRFISDFGGGIEEAIRHPEGYFAYEDFGRDIKQDLDEDEEYDAELLEMSDYDCGERYIDDLYGNISEVPKDIIETYFDYERLGRDMEYGGDIDYIDGYVFWAN